MGKRRERERLLVEKKTRKNNNSFCSPRNTQKRKTKKQKKQVPNKTIPYLAPDPAIAWPNVTVTQGRVKTVAYQDSKTVSLFFFLRERKGESEKKKPN